MQRIHGSLTCPCDPCLVLLNSTLFEQFLRLAWNARGMGLGGLVNNVPNLPGNLKKSLFYIANVRNNFCHHRPWFESQAERDRFIREVNYVSDVLRIEHWCQHPDNRAKFAAPPASVVNPNNTSKKAKRSRIAKQPEEQQQQHGKEATPKRSGSVYIVPKDASAELAKKIKEAEEFASSQRQIITHSQQQADDLAGEIIDDPLWACKNCGFDNDADFVLCAICGKGEAPGRWTCPICLQMNFDQETSCSLCYTPKLIAHAKAKNTGWTKQLPYGKGNATADQSSEINAFEPMAIPDNQTVDTTILRVNAVPLNEAKEKTLAKRNGEHSANKRLSPDSIQQSAKRQRDSWDLNGWSHVPEKSSDDLNVYRNDISGVEFTVQLPLPDGWKLVTSSSQPTQRLCFERGTIRQSIYPQPDVPEGWQRVGQGIGRRVYEKREANADGSKIIFETPWPLPEGWILSVSKSRPNRLCYLRVADGFKTFRYPRPENSLESSSEM